jgi:hypothetical protein
MTRLQTLARMFMKHEGAAWTATVAWLSFVAAMITLKGARYDSGARLDLKDWADVGTFVSAIVAPIAVLWVVRSFYVQKRELAEAVQAAALQASALQEQNKLLREDRLRALMPRIVVGVRSSVIEDLHPRLLQRNNESGRRYLEQFDILVRNTGHGTAYEVRLSFAGAIAEGVALWNVNSEVISEVLVTNASVEHHLSRRPDPTVGQTVNLMFTVEYLRMDRSLGRQFFIYNCVTGMVDETTEARYEALVAANGFID